MEKKKTVKKGKHHHVACMPGDVIHAHVGKGMKGKEPDGDEKMAKKPMDKKAAFLANMAKGRKHHKGKKGAA